MVSSDINYYMSIISAALSSLSTIYSTHALKYKNMDSPNSKKHDHSSTNI